MPKTTSLEKRINATGAIQYGEFTAHNGETGDTKVVLDSLLNDPEHKELLGDVVANLSNRLKPFKPEVVLPMPEGADILGQKLARELGARAILLEWEDKDAGRLKFRNQSERIVLCLAARVMLADDVFRTGSTFWQALDSFELARKQLVGAAIVDRSDPKQSHQLPFEVKSVVKRFYPLRREQLAPDD